MGIDYSPIHLEGEFPSNKEGHKCCSCCCDVRRAVIIVNAIQLGSLIYVMIVAAFVFKNADAIAENISDDQAKEVFMNMKPVGIFFYIVFFISMSFSCVGIYGAIIYNKYLVAGAGASHVITLIINCMTINIGGAIASAFFLYPHVFLYNEIQSGVMSPKTYASKEEHSCCCV